MKLITFSGVDGSGKSTQLKLLKEKLEQEGKKVFYFHAIEFSLANKLARIAKGKKEFTPGSEKASTKASWLSLQLRKFFLSIDLCRFDLLRKKLEKEGYDCILSDRYFYDSVINILYLQGIFKASEKVFLRAPYEAKRNGRQVKKLFADASIPTLWFEKYIPKPDHAFYFQITAEEIIQRDRIPEQGIDYLKDKIVLFKQKKDAFGLISIDASGEQSFVAQTITKMFIL